MDKATPTALTPLPIFFAQSSGIGITINVLMMMMIDD